MKKDQQPGQCNTQSENMFLILWK